MAAKNQHLLGFFCPVSTHCLAYDPYATVYTTLNERLRIIWIIRVVDSNITCARYTTHKKTITLRKAELFVVEENPTRLRARECYHTVLKFMSNREMVNAHIISHLLQRIINI
jgi:hypothetical protein